MTRSMTASPPGGQAGRARRGARTSLGGRPGGGGGEGHERPAAAASGALRGDRLATHPHPRPGYQPERGGGRGAEAVREGGPDGENLVDGADAGEPLVDREPLVDFGNVVFGQ